MIGPRLRTAAPALALWLLLMAACAAFIARTPFGTDLSAFLPRSPNAAQRLLIEQLQSGQAARTLLMGISGGDADARADASRALASALRRSGDFEQVQNGDGADWRATGEWLVAHRYQLSPAVTPERFSVAGLRDAVDDTLALIGTPAGLAARPLLERDPTGETQRIAQELIPAHAPRSEAGVWVSRQAPRALLLATTRAGGDDLDGQARALATVRAAFAPSAARGLALEMTGAGVFAVDSRARIQHEAAALAVVGALVVGTILLASFGSLTALLIAFVPVATGVMTGTAAVALAFGNVHGLTLAFGSTLIGETVDYALYYLIQARDGGAAVWRVRHWPTVRLGLLTSVAGFAALVLSGFPGLAQLGVFSVAGLAAAAAATRWLLPALAPRGAEGQGLRRHIARAANVLLDALPRARAATVLAAALAAAVLAWQGAGLWSASLSAMSPIPRSTQLLDEQLRADVGAQDARTLVVVQGATEEETLQRAESAAAALEALVSRGAIDGYDSVTRVLPSRAAQAARLAALPPSDVLRPRLAEALAGSPLPAARLAPFVQDVDAARHAAPLTRESLQDGPLAALARGLLVARKGGGWAALLPLSAERDIDRAAIETAVARVPGAAVVDVKFELDRLYAQYMGEALREVALGALAVVLLLAAHLRSARRLAAVCRPLVLAVLLVLGGWAAGHAWLGWPALGILHLVGLLLIVAVGSNYALFFDQLAHAGAPGARGERGAAHRADTLASLVLANATTVVSFTLIAVSDIPALSAIGRVVAPGALLALLLSAAFAGRRRSGRMG